MIEKQFCLIAEVTDCLQPALDRASSTKEFTVLSQSPIKSVTQYACDSGYYIIGSAFSYCEQDGNGIQTTSLPECQGRAYHGYNRAG